MGHILSLKPEGIDKQIHPEVLDEFNEFIAKVRSIVPLDTMTEGDLKRYLTDSEKHKFQENMDKILISINTCVDIEKNSPSDVKDKLYQFKINTIWPMFNIIRLLYDTHRRKIGSLVEDNEKKLALEKKRLASIEEELRRIKEQKEAERRQKEEDERWRDACRAIAPPRDDARKYLDRPGEYDEFIKATADAIEVYIEKGPGYLKDSRTFDYRWCLEKINDRKEEERRHIDASLAAQEYNNRLNKEIYRLKGMLSPNKKALKAYFEKNIKDSRYTGDGFGRFLPDEERKAFDGNIVDIADKRLKELVNEDFRLFVEGKYLRIFFLLPSASYSFQGIPCIDFAFDVFAVLETDVWLKPGQKTFDYYTYDLPWGEEDDRLVPLKAPVLLGYDYALLMPKDLGGYLLWQRIPLVLFQGLMKGKMQPAGTQVVLISDHERKYQVKGFKEEVTVPKVFANYLKKIGSIDQMVKLGIINQETANIIRINLNPSAAEQGTGSLQDEQETGFKDEELVARLISLGIPRKTAEGLLNAIPKDMTLHEAIKYALQIIAES